MSEVPAVPALKGKRVLVLGATGGLGGVLARLLAVAGADLVLSGRNASRLGDLAADCGGEAVPADLCSGEGRAALVGAAGQLDGLVGAAGVAPLAPVRYLKDEDFSACLDLNARAPLLLARDLLRARGFRPGASIVWISSVVAAGGTAGYAAYAASKAALEAASRCLAAEVAPRGIRVNCVAAGMIRGRMAESAGERISREELEAHWGEYPLGPGEPDDVAGAVVFLLGSGARWMTGSTLLLDGGYGLAGRGS